MGLDIYSAIEQRVQQNPDCLDTPFKKALYEAVKNRDSKKGAELVNNFCNSMNVDPKTAYNAAGNYMSQMVQNGPQQAQRR